MTFSLSSSITPGRCIVFLVCLSLTAVLFTSSPTQGVEPLAYHDVQFIPRQNTPSSVVPSVPVESRPSTTTTTSQANQPSQQSSNPAPNPSTPTSTPAAATPTTSKQEPSTTTTQPPQTTSAPPPQQQLSSVQSTGADGAPTVVVVTVQVSNTNASPTSSAPPKESESDSGSSGLGTGSIVGLSVAGGIALLGIAAFFIWKFTRGRRSSGFDDDEIKWPDLNSENHVPGQDDHGAPPSLSEQTSIRGQSFQGSYADGGLGASQSQVDLYVADPYAVPPLPHLNPSQPYRDDPGAAPYHDNFSVPAFHGSRPSSPSIRGEAIPMNQINRTRSPAPQSALHTAYGGRQSPGPQDAYGGGAGRQSPGPQDAYGGGYGRQSPGPQDAYGGGYGRRSPGPQDAYGPR